MWTHEPKDVQGSSQLASAWLCQRKFSGNQITSTVTETRLTDILRSSVTMPTISYCLGQKRNHSNAARWFQAVNSETTGRFDTKNSGDENLLSWLLDFIE